ncbi:formate--tetrahydrofolate ligase [Paenibacillus thiaminolyticus]|uniref:Formate--tetrahydrofolate ligase n=2 Tax=Paenibacillus thiaminolyticus TaxID=49283 RepID=A0AAP9DVU0_PANTH|nr:formate--tetrahydrofolate ligase [Paenibacillus thiaminolyticus]SUA50728.1 formate--tetrahydrofolate ligase (formyltetrahydrofolate synthetase) [Paenibacillus thiaminolyticus]
MMRTIVDVAARIGVPAEQLELYGKYKAKLGQEVWEANAHRPDGKLILVSAMNPTPAGEGKTLTTIGLTQGLNRIGRQAVAALREPSLGPCMGMKGGATGSGRAQIVPAEDINLHFTGDIHAITSAHNLLAAMIDNHLYQGNALGIQPERIVWKRAVDMNDRALRHIVVGLGDGNGAVREDGFMITTASEIMAALCLSEDMDDLRTRLGRMVVAYTYEGEPVTASQLQAVEAMCVLLKDAIYPNLVQTVEGDPVLVHGGPFANIAHGCSSVRATRYALKLADYVVTEAGFGADLGAEKFMDIKCRQSGLAPSVVVLVATVRALKYNGGLAKDQLEQESPEALAAGFANLRRHVENMRSFGVPVVVAVNRFAADTEKELEAVQRMCSEIGTEAILSEAWAKGGEGAAALAEAVVRLADAQEEGRFRLLYEDELPIEEKIEAIVTRIYRGAEIAYSPAAKRALRELKRFDTAKLPVCMAKTPYSFSDRPGLLGAPEGFTLEVRDIRWSAGAGFIVVHTGQVLTMPGLPKHPAAERIRLDEEQGVVGLSGQ